MIAHKTGWTSTAYGEDRHHRTIAGAERRMVRAHNGMGCPPDGVWCSVTGSQAHECSCPQCRRARGES